MWVGWGLEGVSRPFDVTQSIRAATHHPTRPPTYLPSKERRTGAREKEKFSEFSIKECRRGNFSHTRWAEKLAKRKRCWGGGGCKSGRNEADNFLPHPTTPTTTPLPNPRREEPGEKNPCLTRRNTVLTTAQTAVFLRDQQVRPITAPGYTPPPVLLLLLGPRSLPSESLPGPTRAWLSDQDLFCTMRCT